MKVLLRRLREHNIHIALKGDHIQVSSSEQEIPPDLFEQIKRHKEAIIQYLKNNIFNEADVKSIPKIEVQKEGYPLSSVQRRMWLLSQFKEGNLAYNMPAAYILEGELDVASLEYAFKTLIARHESLRTIFKEDDRGELRQFIHTDIIFLIKQEDLRRQKGQREIVRNLVQREYSIPFDLATGPLLRAGLYQLEDNKWIFIYTMHHIISDGWSMGVLIKELLLMCDWHHNGQQDTLPPLRIQYKDYAAWQQEQLSGIALKAHKDYWLGQFGGELPVLELPADKVRPAVKTYRGNTISGMMDATVSNGLKDLVREGGATLFMALQSLINILLYKYTGQEDIITGTPVAGREHLDLEDQIGVYINTLALRIQFRGDDSYRELLGNVKQVMLSGYKHVQYPFDELIEELQLRRDMSRNPLFDVMIMLQNNEVNQSAYQQQLAHLKAERYYDVQNILSKFDLSFDFIEVGSSIQVSIEYNSDIYAESTVERMLNHLLQLCNAIVQHPDTSIRMLEFMSAEEQAQLSITFNNTGGAYAYDKTIIDLFEQQAALQPDKTALTFKSECLTYKALNEQANGLADYLRTTYNIIPGDLIGIMVERSELMMVALLAILKSGAAYVPIDPAYPQDRITYILEDSRAKVLLAGEIPNAYPGEVLLVNNMIHYPGSRLYLPQLITPQDLCYVIYTSGSTGQPKGVMISHYNVLNFFAGMDQVLPVSADDCLLALTSTSFDISVLELLWTLCRGIEVVLHPWDISLSNLDRYMEEDSSIHPHKPITMLQSTPSFLKLVEEDGSSERLLKSLRLLLVGGEAFPVSLLEQLHRRYPARIYNMYGPTETTIWSCVGELKEDKVSIGHPILNTQVYILNPDLQLVPVGVTGELYIGGEGVSRGYLNRPELTAERFIEWTGMRLYKTGDLARWQEDGSIEFLGRKDQQVKIRGHRIEPGEIEVALQTYKGITAAVVIAMPDIDGDQELVAYVVSNKSLHVNLLQSHLAAMLPAYMLPGKYVQLTELPLTPNGKLDRKQLPQAAGAGLSASSGYVAPRNEIEEQLVRIWEEVLGKEKIGIRDNFFELGGHSLKATRLVARIKKQFITDLGIMEVFVQPTIEGMAAWIGTLLWVKEAAPIAREDANIEKLIF